MFVNDGKRGASAVLKDLPESEWHRPDLVAAASEEVQHKVKERSTLLDADKDARGLAKYKLEVVFSCRHTGRAPAGGIVTMWDNAAQLHGGGDAKLYICDDVRAPNIIGCRGVLPNNALNSTNSQVVCPHCCKVWRAEELVGEVYYKLPIEKWADVLYQWFLALEMRADIRLKYNQTNRRTATERELEKKLQGDILERATELRDKSSVIYPLRNIIKDTSAGADLRKRILAFLRA